MEWGYAKKLTQGITSTPTFQMQFYGCIGFKQGNLNPKRIALAKTRQQKYTSFVSQQEQPMLH